MVTFYNYSYKSQTKDYQAISLLLYVVASTLFLLTSLSTQLTNPTALPPPTPTTHLFCQLC